MGKLHDALSTPMIDFIGRQKLFFVATAAPGSRINLSPKGLDSFRILNERRVLWLNLTGSGNETAAHVQQDSRMTIMFCSFEGAPLILRLYGSARAVHRNDPDWSDLLARFGTLPGARQIFDLTVESVQTSCGNAVPCFQYVGDREQLTDWLKKKGDDGVAQYWRTTNQFSIDRLPTHIMEKNG